MTDIDIADTCDGTEQDAFEEWAAKNRYDMHQHPLHWLFLDKRTSAARDGWRAGIKHSRDRILSSISLSDMTALLERVKVLEAALKLARDMFTANDVHVPHTIEVIDEALGGSNGN